MVYQGAIIPEESNVLSMSEVSTWNRYARGEIKVNGYVDYDSVAKQLQWDAPCELAFMASDHLLVGPTLDIGCGSGLAGEGLITLGHVIDGMDFSRGMLEKAKTRGYSDTYCQDVRLPIQARTNKNKPEYANIISCGLFGDFIDPKFLQVHVQYLQEQASVCIAGRSDRYCSRGFFGKTLTSVLEEEGFSIKKEEEKVGHVDEHGRPVHYTFVDATR